jgi:Protein of unknown function (DUF1553)/Protein of unknown function (DUF1549)
MPLPRRIPALINTAILAWLAANPSSAQPPQRKAAGKKSQPASVSNWTAKKHEPREVADLIDRSIDRRLTEAKIPSSPPADDAEFVRRLSLDLRGRIPTASRVAAFLADTDPDKRRTLIDEFLGDEEYGEHFSIIWYHRMVQPNMDNQGLLAKNFQGWLSERFNTNDGWDKTVKSILTAAGERDKNPATVFWLNNVEGNNRREVAPNKVAAAASHLFLGLKLECCECHNHPFDEGLKQTDFWGMAAFFTTTHADKTSKQAVQGDEVPVIREQTAPIRAQGKAKAREVTAPYGQIVIPDSKGKTVAARYPLTETPKFSPGISLRTELADWLTAARNPYFAKAAVNKLWTNFFGRGIVNPVDDMRPGAANSHPELLDALAIEFAASGFDQKHLIRGICLSRAYQRSSQPLPENKEDDELLSHMRLKVMTADMLYDSLTIVLEHAVAEAAAGRSKVNPMRRNQGNARDQFRRFFHAEADDDAGVVEDYTHGVPQVLRLMNSQQMNNTAAVVKNLMKDAKPEQTIESLYLRALARKPTAAEAERIAVYINTERDKTKAYGDVMWALLNSAEFMFNH